MKTAPNELTSPRHHGSSVTVVGCGVSGLALAVLAKKLGYSVYVTEIGPINDISRGILVKHGICFESGGHSPKMLESDMVVLSSGVSPASVPVHMSKKRGIPIIGEMDFTWPYLKGKIIGITGSNGKTTTTMLTGHLFREAGFSVGIAGNVGSPLADHAGKEHEIIVAELSSFQLYWAESSKLNLAIVTNIEPDHIDWHGSLEEYYRCKKKILGMLPFDGNVICQSRDLNILFPVDHDPEYVIPLIWEDGSPGKFKRFINMTKDMSVLMDDSTDLKLFDFEYVKLLGKHNLENAAMAAAAFTLFEGDPKTIKEHLASFGVLPHRCELVAKSGGVSYVDDSKGTNVAATIAALTSLQGKKVVILGGKGKGEDYGPLASAVARESVGAVLIGDETPRIREALVKVKFSNFVEVVTMDEAVRKAAEMSNAGDIVLLSPACTSWDMYNNYKERGDDFKRSVDMLFKGDIFDAG